MGDAVEDAAWRNDPDVVRRFLAARPRYEELCDEVAYILRKRLRHAGVAFSSLPARAKSLASFLQKIERKRYEQAF
jgi:ppGpp synthetase/RelA/SpoT-type nucleotidyltranferase